MGVKGNEKADETAKEAAERLATRMYPERFTSLTNVERTITKYKWEEVKNWLLSRFDRQGLMHRARYHLALEIQGQDQEDMDTAVQVSRRYL